MLLLILLLHSCKVNQFQRISLKGNALGTYYTIHFYTENTDSEYVQKIQFSIDSILSSFNSIASIYDNESIISKINNNIDAEINDMFLDIFNAATYISNLTDGAFDITISPLVDAWGFGKSERKELTQNQIDSLLDFVGYNKIRISEGFVFKADNRVTLNMNAIAKGYAVDLISNYLEDNRIFSYLVEIGGEVRVGQAKPDKTLWNVAIEKPAESAIDMQEEGEIVSLENMSIATSGTYRQYVEINGIRYSHTINPKDGYPVSNNLISATILTEKCMLADALATACMVLGVERSIALCESLNNTEGYFISENKKGGWIIQSTSGFNKFVYSK